MLDSEKTLKSIEDIIINYSAIIIENIENKKKILVVEKNGMHWILPGGKPEINEDASHCINRELSEELSGTLAYCFQTYNTFNGTTPTSKKPLICRAYFAYLHTELGKASKEITRKEWIGREDIKNKDRKSTRLNSSHSDRSRMPSSA